MSKHNVSTKDKTTLPLMKCVRILDHDDLSFMTSIGHVSIVLSLTSSTYNTYISIGNLLLSILALEKNHVWLHDTNLVAPI
jgi:hypothetical protein